MKTLAFALSSLVLGIILAHDAAAQTVYPPAYRAPMASDGRVTVQPGAGGGGGMGGGDTGAARPIRVSGCAAPERPVDLRTRGATPPPLDPTRKIYPVSCTQPFDPMGKGNLCCS